MKEFMLYIRNQGQSTLSPDQHEEFLKKCESYIEDLKKQGKLVSAQPLEIRGKIISKQVGEWEADPLDLSQEVNVGYYHIRAKDLEEAIEIAKRNPEFEYKKTARIEVRPIKTSEKITGYVYPKNL